jgi:hypothetical protein
VIDLFQPRAPMKAQARMVKLCIDDDPAAMQAEQRMQALRLAWAARTKRGQPLIGASAQDRAQARRRKDAERRAEMQGTARHAAAKAAKLAAYHAMTEEERAALRAYQRDWYARRKAASNER